MDEAILMGGMYQVPRVQEIFVEIFGNMASKCVNPNEAMAMGVSIQSGIMQGNVNELILLDVTSISLGL